MNVQRFIWMITLFATTAGAAEEVLPGRWELSSDGELYSLNANQAGIRPILDAIREISPADFRIRAFQDRDVTLQTYNIPLDELLEHLELSFVLQYERANNEDGYQISKGWISFSEPASATAPRSPFADTAPPSDSSANPGQQTIPDEIRRQLAAAKSNEEYRAVSPITVKVDGTTGDWPTGIPRQFVSGRQLIAGPAPTNNADASFGLAGAADENYLYLAIDIADDRLAFDKADKLPLAQDDNLEIIITASGVPVSAVINRHHVLTSRVDGDDSLQTTSRQLVSYHNGTKAAIMNSGNGWQLEIAVPLDSLGDKADVNALGFNVLLNDVDQGEGSPTVLSWSSVGTLVPGQSSYNGSGVLRILKVP